MAVFAAGCATNPGVAPAKPVAVAPQPVAKAEPADAEAGSQVEETITNAVASRTESSKDAGDKVICRQIMPTGSHRKKTICRTVKEIRQARDESQDAMRSKQGPSLRPPQ